MEEVEGEEGDFLVTVKRKPRYVLEHRCTACRNCVQNCPAVIPDPFNQGLSREKAIHIYFSQAIPLIAYIDPDYCLYLKEGRCGICADVCKNKAIDFKQGLDRVQIKVGAIILAIGFDPYDPRVRHEWGYGRFRNVVTAMEFERITCSTGPYAGEILRPSDLGHPHKVAWIQCVGSRQVYEGSKPYCSAVCCSYTQKQALLFKTHHPEGECVIFHNDVRAPSKGLERFFQRAKGTSGVRFVRAYPRVAGETPEGGVILHYVTPEGRFYEEVFDLVVLSQGLLPPKEIEGLGGKLGLELNEYGFLKTDPFDPCKTSKEGVYVSGAAKGPGDIPEAVWTGSGAASQASRSIAFRRDKLTVKKEYPQEREVEEEEPRVGVFVCHCGANIGKVVSVPELVQWASKLPYVVHAEEDLFWCSTSATRKITELVKEKGLNRVVVAACTPKTHEPTFMEAIRAAGLNIYLVDMANIREHCTWVHSLEPEKAKEKAKELILMSLARSLLLGPLPLYQIPVIPKTLVVGGGVSGMTCALDLAQQGIEVWLLEKEKELGGLARRLRWTLEHQEVKPFLDDLIAKVYRHPLIHVLTEAEIVETGGYIGNFVTKVKVPEGEVEIRHGVTIIATGAVEHRPSSYLYGKDPRVMTGLEFEGFLSQGAEGLKVVAFIQCVEARNPKRNYCSRVCCGETLKNSLKLKEMNPEAQIFVFYRDMTAFGYIEALYKRAQEAGIRFVLYDPEDPPLVEAHKEGMKVRARDLILQEEVEVTVDRLVLASGASPNPLNPTLSELFKVSLDEDGFFKEAHVKLGPLDFPTAGVFLCGMAHYPKHLPEAVGQGHGVASRAMTVLSKKEVTSSGVVCFVDESRCMGCGACEEVCLYGAIFLQETKQGKKAKVRPVLCKGCGLCNALCPTGAVQVGHFKDEQIFAEIDALVGKEEGLKKIGQGLAKKKTKVA